jgi:hypothetical protein
MSQNGEFNRRLRDRILAAFDLAHTAGDAEIVGRLREALELAERQAGGHNAGRRDYDLPAESSIWAQFVAARNAYKEACAGGAEDADARFRAFEGVKEAYRRWSLS